MIAALKDVEQRLCAQFQGAVVSNNRERQSKMLLQLAEVHILRARKTGRLDDFPRAVGTFRCRLKKYGTIPEYDSIPETCHTISPLVAHRLDKKGLPAN